MSEVYFPREIFFQILLHLPPKTLRRFLSVSKLWYSIITSNLFISQHLLQPPHPQNNSFFFLKFLNVFSQEKYEEFSFYLNNKETQIQETQNTLTQVQETKIQEFEIQESPNEEFCDTLGVPCDIVYPPMTRESQLNCIVGVANGLILFFEDMVTIPELVLWNPAVYVFDKLPSSGIECENPDMYVFGFWFDSRDGDYKVMRIVYRSNNELDAKYDRPPLAEVFSLNTGEWGRINADGVKCYMPNDSQSYAYVNGRSHWVAYSHYPLFSLIMSFDMNDGVFREIKLPFCLLTMLSFELRVTETMGCLAVIGNDTTVFRVWVMKKYGDFSSWTNLCDIPIVSGPDYYKFVGFWKNDDVLLLKGTRQLVRFVPGSKSLIDLDIFLGGLASRWTYVGKYEESLALLDYKFFDEWGIEEETETIFGHLELLLQVEY